MWMSMLLRGGGRVVVENKFWKTKSVTLCKELIHYHWITFSNISFIPIPHILIQFLQPLQEMFQFLKIVFKPFFRSRINNLVQIGSEIKLKVDIIKCVFFNMFGNHRIIMCEHRFRIVKYVEGVREDVLWVYWLDGCMQLWMVIYYEQCGEDATT